MQNEVIYVQSPTYALANTYNTSPKVHHIDLYRYHDRKDALCIIEDLGIIELLQDSKSFCLIEWPIDDLELTGDNVLNVRIDSHFSQNKRTIIISSCAKNL